MTRMTWKHHNSGNFRVKNYPRAKLSCKKVFVYHDDLTHIQLLTTFVKNIFVCLVFVVLGKYEIFNSENFPIYNMLPVCLTVHVRVCVCLYRILPHPCTCAHTVRARIDCQQLWRPFMSDGEVLFTVF